MNYHNTSNLSGANLQEAVSTAKAQDDKVYAIFEANKVLSPFDCWTLYKEQYGDVLLTSIRRAITNLTKVRKLAKTDLQKDGGYGRPENIWTLN